MAYKTEDLLAQALKEIREKNYSLLRILSLFCRVVNPHFMSIFRTIRTTIKRSLINC